MDNYGGLSDGALGPQKRHFKVDFNVLNKIPSSGRRNLYVTRIFG